jgi:hypothetical protein
MSQFAIIFQVLVGVLALFFIYLTYMNAKTWRWVHVTFTFFVFAAAMAFMFLAAMTLRTRAAWVGLHDKTEQQLADTEKQIEKITRGDLLDLERKEPSIVSLREELGRINLDRGRVWRGCQPAGRTPDGSVLVRTSPPPPPPLDPTAPPAPTVVKKNNIQPKTVLHVFREGPLTPAAPAAAAPAPDLPAMEPGQTGPIIPAAYIGEFEAAAATDDTVTIRPTMPLSQDQLAAGSVAGTWVLYEVCPIDGHQWFQSHLAGMDEQQAAAALQKLIPPAGIPQDRYQRLIESYLRDGKEANVETDPPENIWMPVKFLKTYTVEVDAPTINSIDVEPYNTEGRAQLDRLRRAEPGKEPSPVVFGPEPPQISTALLDKQTADELIAQQICQQDGAPIFRRKLNDYERLFHTISRRIAEINTRGMELELDNKALIASTEKAEAHSKLLDDLKVQLTDDLAKVQAEQQELKKYADALQARVAEVQGELSQLYRSNKALSRELAEVSARLTEEIDRRAREATARAP